GPGHRGEPRRDSSREARLLDLFARFLLRLQDLDLVRLARVVDELPAHGDPVLLLQVFPLRLLAFDRGLVELVEGDLIALAIVDDDLLLADVVDQSGELAHLGVRGTGPQERSERGHSERLAGLPSELRHGSSPSSAPIVAARRLEWPDVALDESGYALFGRCASSPRASAVVCGVGAGGGTRTHTASRTGAF